MGGFGEEVAWGSIGLSFKMYYLQLQDPKCLTSRRTPKEQAACFMAHSLGYVVLSLAHTASSERLSGHDSTQTEQRPRPILASHRHFFPALHWISSHDLASVNTTEEKNRQFLLITLQCLLLRRAVGKSRSVCYNTQDDVANIRKQLDTNDFPLQVIITTGIVTKD